MKPGLRVSDGVTACAPTSLRNDFLKKNVNDVRIHFFVSRSYPLAQFTEQLEGWAKEFGGDYELHMFGRRVILVSALADVRRMLNLRPSKFHRGMTAVR